MSTIHTNEIYVALKNAADDEDRKANSYSDNVYRYIHSSIANALMKLAIEFYEQSL